MSKHPKSVNENARLTQIRPVVENDVFEYNPDPGAGLTSAPEGAESSTNVLLPFSTLGNKSVGDFSNDSIDSASAYEFFHNKTMQSTAYDKGFTINAHLRKLGDSSNEYQYMPSFVLRDPAVKVEPAYTRGLSTRAASAKFAVEGDQYFDDMEKAYIMSKGEKATHFESPAVRLKRLQMEMEELTEFVQAQKIQTNIENQSETTQRLTTFTQDVHDIFQQKSPNELMNELDTLNAQIKALAAKPELQTLLYAVDPQTTRQSGYEVVLEQLSQHLQKLRESKETPPKESKPSYELYCMPSFNPILETSRVTSLEKRLADLESKIGIAQIYLLPFTDIRSGITELLDRMSLLDNDRVDSMTKKIQSILGSLQMIQNQKNESLSFQDEMKVESLFDICGRWKQAEAAIPIAMDRLKALSNLHNEAGGMNTRLNVVEAQQNDLTTLLQSAKQNLETLKATIDENLSWATNTVDALQKRVLSLQETTS